MNDGPVRPHRRRPAAVVLVATALVVLTGCADFSVEPAEATVQASLSAAAMHPEDDSSFPIPTVSVTPSTTPSVPASETTPADPCRPTDPAIIAACLDTPWGLAVLPGGTSALVGERTTGRILRVAPEAEPIEVARVDGIDTSSGGGLLGLALSPHYAEDGLVYAFVTTATDNRIVRIAQGDIPKDIFTGIPRGTGTDGRDGGRIAFGADGYLYVATGDAGVPGAGNDPDSLAGKVLRLDEFGKPAPASGSDASGTAAPGTTAPSTTAPSTTAPSTTAPGTTGSAAPETTAPATDNTDPGTDPLNAIYATGLGDPTGLCALGTSGVGVVDRLGAADVLTTVTAGADQSAVPAVWSFPVSDGGAVDCAQNETVLAATSLDLKLVTALTLGAGGGFTGSPTQLAKDTYGRLLSLSAGTRGVLWATTANRDGQGEPQPRDDMVVVIPTGGGGSGDGLD